MRVSRQIVAIYFSAIITVTFLWNFFEGVTLGSVRGRSFMTSATLGKEGVSKSITFCGGMLTRGVAEVDDING